MKKILLALATTLSLPNMSYAAACPTGTDAAPTAGCTITTSDITYTLTGGITTTADSERGLFLSSGNTTPSP